MDPKHVGYCYLLPLDLKKSNDCKKVPITGLRHKPIGEVTCKFKPQAGKCLKSCYLSLKDQGDLDFKFVDCLSVCLRIFYLLQLSE